MRRLKRFLLSRKLATWLLLGCAVWIVVGTAVPQSSDGMGAVASWNSRHPLLSMLTGPLGLHHAWTAPIFSAAMVLLAVSTALCAIERTKRAAALLKHAGGVRKSRLRQLETSPDFVLVPRTPMSSDELLSSSQQALRDAGFSVRATRSTVEAVAGRAGLLGSPLFHWGLALLFVVVAVGQLTRSEGLIGVPVGESVTNSAGQYGRLQRGALYVDAYRDISIRVTKMPLDQKRDDVEIGPIPHVQLVRKGRVVAEGEVYPNHPVRYRSILVHNSAYGMTALVDFYGLQGDALKGSRVYFDLDQKSDTGWVPATIGYDVDGRPFDLVLKPVLQETEGGRRRVAIEFVGSSGETRTVVAQVESRADVGIGHVVVHDPVYYSRLSVVDDASVVVIYSLFVLAFLGSALSLLVPGRTVWVMAVEGEHGVEAHVVTRHERGDPVLGSATAERLSEALEADIAGT